MKIAGELKHFIEGLWDRRSPLLLGYSGGPDSKALLYLLLDLGIRPHLAHVDHGWREESRREAEALRQEAEGLGLPFHTVRLEPDRSEAGARRQRLAFFASLFERYPFQALLLGHQADDGAETSLKRVLEGAHLVHLGGIQPVTKIEGLPIWRPLLGIERREVRAFLEKTGLCPIEDRTNSDPKYLRARMRTEILPILAASFGKEISSNLALLGKRAFELSEYLDRKTDAALESLQRRPWGLVLPCLLQEPIEVRHLLQRLELPWTRTILDAVVEALVKKEASVSFEGRFFADRGYFFYLTQSWPRFEGALPIREGTFFSGDWKVEISRLEGSSQRKKGLHWLDVFLGDYQCVLPETGSFLQRIDVLGKSLSKRLGEQKIPAFLRSLMPYILGEDGEVADLFSQKGGSGYLARFSVFSNRLPLER